MADNTTDIGEVFLKNVRLSFPDLFEPKTFKNKDGSESKPRYGCSFLLPKDNSAVGKYPGPEGKTMPALIALKKAKEAVLLEYDSKFDFKKLKAANHCVRDGDEERYDGYENMFYVSCGNPKQPVLVDELRKKIEQSSGKLYGGCYVNAIVRLWVQKPGKNDDGTPRPLRVNCSVEAVQHWEDGEAFGRKPIDPTKGFEVKDGVGFDNDEDEGEDEDDLV